MTILAFNRNGMDDDLIGVWKLESTQVNGQPATRERVLWVFRQGFLTIVRDGDTLRARISVRPSAVPKELDTDIPFQPIGIYAIDGDTLRVAQVFPSLPRPTEFTTEWGDMRTITVLRRLDVDPRMPLEELNDLLLSEFGPAIEYPERMEFDESAKEFIALLRIENSGDEEAMSEKEKVIYHVSWLITEIDNGGFYQYFYNSTGESAIETAGYLRKIGAEETAMLVETGCQLFPNAMPAKEYRERRAQLEQFTLTQMETLRDLEERFFSRREDLHVLLRRYWESDP